MCGTTFDKHGDHAFGCRRTSKTALHDAITKLLAITLRPLLTLTNRTNTAFDAVRCGTNRTYPRCTLQAPGRHHDPPFTTSKTNEPTRCKTATPRHCHTPPPITNGIPSWTRRTSDQLETLALFADRSHIASMKEKHQGKTTTSATQIDTIATITERNCIRAGHIPSSHRKSTIDFIPQLIDFGITINLRLEFIPSS
jgi:hypothetical protein